MTHNLSMGHYYFATTETVALFDRELTRYTIASSPDCLVLVLSGAHMAIVLVLSGARMTILLVLSGARMTMTRLRLA